MHCSVPVSGYNSDGGVVRASASGAVDSGLIPGRVFCTSVGYLSSYHEKAVKAL